MGSSICCGQRANDPNIDEDKFKYEPEYVNVAEKSLNAEQNLHNKVNMSSKKSQNNELIKKQRKEEEASNLDQNQAKKKGMKLNMNGSFCKEKPRSKNEKKKNAKQNLNDSNKISTNKRQIEKSHTLNENKNKQNKKFDGVKSKYLDYTNLSNTKNLIETKQIEEKKTYEKPNQNDTIKNLETDKKNKTNPKLQINKISKSNSKDVLQAKQIKKEKQKKEIEKQNETEEKIKIKPNNAKNIENTNTNIFEANVIAIDDSHQSRSSFDAGLLTDNHAQLEVLNPEYFLTSGKGIRLTLDEVSKTPKRLDLRKQIECESFKYDEDSIDLNKRSITPNIIKKKAAILSEDSTDSIPFVSAVHLYNKFGDPDTGGAHSPSKENYDEMYESNLSRPSSDAMPIISSKIGKINYENMHSESYLL